MAKGKGYYSKAARHARKMASCAKCSAQAEKILQGRPRKARTPRAKNPYSTQRRFIGPMAPGTVVIPKRRRTVKRTMTPEAIAAAGRSMAARISARMAARRERRMMRANSMPAV